MSLFQSILADLKKSIDIQTEHTEMIAKICSEVLHVTITSDQLSITRGKVVLRIPSTVKMALKLNQEVLLKKVQAFDPSIHTIG